MQSLRQREFFRNNPDLADTFRNVVQTAWKAGSSKPVKKALQQYFSHNNVVLAEDENLGHIQALGAKRRLLMLDFWRKNPQAKEKFSVSMKWAWKRVKEAEENEKKVIQLPIPAYPPSLVKAIKEWAEEKGYKTNEKMFTMNCNTGSDRALAHSMSYKIASQYFSEHLESCNFYADTLVLLLANLAGKLDHKKDATPSEKLAVTLIRTEAKKNKTSMNLDDLIKLYVGTVTCLMSDPKAAEELKSIEPIFVEAEKEAKLLQIRRRAMGLD